MLSRIYHLMYTGNHYVCTLAPSSQRQSNRRHFISLSLILLHSRILLVYAIERSLASHVHCCFCGLKTLRAIVAWYLGFFQLLSSNLVCCCCFLSRVKNPNISRLSSKVQLCLPFPRWSHGNPSHDCSSQYCRLFVLSSTGCMHCRCRLLS